MAKAKTKPSTALQTVDTSTGEIIEAPRLMERRKRQGLFLPTHPRDYRALVAKDAGYFTCNERNVGSSITFNCINSREVNNVLFSAVYPEPESVQQLVIVDADDVIGNLVLRTISAVEWVKLIEECCDALGHAIHELRITAEMIPYTSKRGFSFHIVKFNYEIENEERVRMIEQFVQDIPNAAHCWRDLPVIE